jgi:hypothetical protein
MRIRYVIMILALILATFACSLLPGSDNGESVPPPTTAVVSITPEVTLTIEPSATIVMPTEAPTLLPTEEFTATPLPPSPTITLTPTPFPLTSYYLQSGTPVGMANFANPAAGCNWMGLAGQVFNIKGEPVSGYVLQVGGSLEGKEVSQMALSGGTPLVGPGGYLITLADHPIESDGSIWVQLYDQSGEAKTGKILLTTYSNCERNLILLNLVELYTLGVKVQLPLILKKAP